MKIYLTRHGESQWNVEGRLQGSFDSTLTEKGKKDSRKLRQYLEQEEIRFDKIYTSTSSRAIETAEVIALNQNGTIILSEKMREMNTGSWQGQTWREIQLQNPEEYHNYWHAPQLYQAQNGGENFKEVQERAVSFIEELLAKNRKQNILIVSHGVILNSILNYYQKYSLSSFWDQSLMPGAALSLLEINDEQVRVVFRGLDHYLIN